MAASKHSLFTLGDREPQHTPIKKRRRPTKHEGDMFLDFPLMLIKGLADDLNHWLLDKNSFTFKTFTALKILNSNAADPRQGNSFSQVFCSVEPYHQLHSLGDVFTKGLLMLTEFMTKKQMPQNIQDKHVLCKLLDFMMQLMTKATEQTPLRNLDRYNETELTTVLANHLFSKLSTSDTFIMDKHIKFKRKFKGNTKCPCEISSCHLAGQFGDTSVGNCTVWHGHLGIIINDDIVIEPLSVGDEDDSNDIALDDNGDVIDLDDNDDDSPGGKSEVKVNTKDCMSRKSQILAETIVFSFLQKQRHPESDNFLFPCIGVTDKEMIVFCYDSQHDVLLESSPIPLLCENITPLGRINTLAIVVAWLVVNYKYLCNGLTEDMKTAKSTFFSQADSKLNTYECNLKLGEVGNAYRMGESVVDFLPPRPTSVLKQLNERLLKFRHDTE